MGAPAFPLPGWFSGESLPWLNKRLWVWPNRRKCDVMLPWKKFLDLKNVSKQRLAVNFFSFFSFRNIYLQGHSLLTSRNFATVATWRNGFSPLFVPFGYSFIPVPAGLLSKLAQHNNLSTKTRMGEKKKGFQSRHPELTFLFNPVIPWIFLESRGVVLGILVGVFCPVLQILTLFQAKKCHFPVFRPGL